MVYAYWYDVFTAAVRFLNATKRAVKWPAPTFSIKQSIFDSCSLHPAPLLIAADDDTSGAVAPTGRGQGYSEMESGRGTAAAVTDDRRVVGGCHSSNLSLLASVGHVG
jgi:hypothetical protein